MSQHFCYATATGTSPTGCREGPLRPQGMEGCRRHAGISPEWTRPFSSSGRPTGTPPGFYAGWNNKSSPVLRSANSVSYLFGPFHRAHVIDDYLSANNDRTFET